MAENSDSMAKAAAILGTVATLLVAFNTWQVSQFDADLRQVESERELNFRIYQSIAESIESGNHQRIRAVRVFVNALATEELRESFLSVLETGELQIYESQQAIPTGAACSNQAVGRIIVTICWRLWLSARGERTTARRQHGDRLRVMVCRQATSEHAGKRWND